MRSKPLLVSLLNCLFLKGPNPVDLKLILFTVENGIVLGVVVDNLSTIFLNCLYFSTLVDPAGYVITF